MNAFEQASSSGRQLNSSCPGWKGSRC